MNKKQLFYLVISLIIALVIRILLGTLPNFSADESFSYYVSKLSSKNILLAMLSDRHPPLHYFMLHYISSYFDSEIALRFPSILFSIVSVFFIYNITYILTNTRSTSLIASLISAVFYSFWYFDYLARMYALAQMSALSATWFLLKILIGKCQEKHYYILYFLSMMISLYSVYFTGLILICHIIAILIINKQERKLWFSIFSVVLLTLPLLYLLLLQIRSGNTEQFSSNTFTMHLATFYSFYFGIPQLLQMLFHIYPNTNTYLSCSLLFSILILIWQWNTLKKFHQENKKSAQFLTIMFFTYITPLFLIVAGVRLFNVRERYFFLLYPYITIIVSIGLNQLRTMYYKHTLLGILLLLNMALVFYYNFNPYLWIFNFKPLAAQVRKLGNTSDLIIHDLPANYFMNFNYYYARKNFHLTEYQGAIYVTEPENQSYYKDGGIKQYSIRTIVNLKKDLPLLQNHRYIWFLTNTMSESNSNKHKEIRLFLAKHFKVKDVKIFTLAYELHGEDTYYLYCLYPKILNSQ